MQNNENLPQSLQEDYDGFFDFEMREEGLYLILYAPRGKGRFVQTEEIVARLNQRKFADYNLDSIKQAVDAVKSQEK